MCFISKLNCWWPLLFWRFCNQLNLQEMPTRTWCIFSFYLRKLVVISYAFFLLKLPCIYLHIYETPLLHFYDFYQSPLHQWNEFQRSCLCWLPSDHVLVIPLKVQNQFWELNFYLKLLWGEIISNPNHLKSYFFQTWIKKIEKLWKKLLKFKCPLSICSPIYSWKIIMLL